MPKLTNRDNKQHLKRRTQEERSASTQDLLVDTTIRLLHADGYAATTTHRIADEAGVSRGALLHHFPSKVDLMIAVVRIVHERERSAFREALSTIADPLERYLALPELSWNILSRPSGVAILMIMVSSRSDVLLAQRLAPLQTQIEVESQDRVLELASQAGLEQDASSRAFHSLVVAAVRGFSIQTMFDESSDKILVALQTLTMLIREHQKASTARK
jgi:AcrR family transcriptional regulator